jgi:hypothetical protein
MAVTAEEKPEPVFESLDVPEVFEVVTELEEEPAPVRVAKAKTAKPAKAEKKVPAKSPDISFIPVGSKSGKNNNERILELHSQGKSNVAIAKELGLGIGEVKLVIDLFEGM